MKLSVGDVVFVMDKKTQAVVPCQLVERISSTTLTGEEIKNIAATPSGKTFTLESYEAPWFSSYDEAYDHLKDAALSLVDATMKKAAKAAQKSFNVRSEQITFDEVRQQSASLSTDKMPDPISSEQVYVDIGGQQVKVTLPKELSNE